MSDARAKAEARRAKILARLSEKNKVQVVEKDEEINEDKDSVCDSYNLNCCTCTYSELSRM